MDVSQSDEGDTIKSIRFMMQTQLFLVTIMENC